MEVTWESLVALRMKRKRSDGQIEGDFIQFCHWSVSLIWSSQEASKYYLCDISHREDSHSALQVKELEHKDYSHADAD